MLIVAVDASLNTRAAGMAVVSFPEGTLLGMEVARTHDVNAAEGMAVIRGLSFLAQRRAPPGSRVLTDSQTVGQMIHREVSRPYLEEIGVDLRAMMHTHHLEVEIVDRRQVQAAHNAARHALKCWTHGTEDKPTWVRTHYVRIPQMLAE